MSLTRSDKEGKCKMSLSFEVSTLGLARKIKKSTRKAYALTLLNAVIRDYSILRSSGQWQLKNYSELKNKVIDLRIRILGIKYTYCDARINKWS
jgi:hypothetical protein